MRRDEANFDGVFGHWKRHKAGKMKGQKHSAEDKMTWYIQDNV